MTHNLPAGVLPVSVQCHVNTMREVPGIYRRKTVMTTEVGTPADGAEDSWVSRPPLLLSVVMEESGEWEIAQVKEFHSNKGSMAFTRIS